MKLAELIGRFIAVRRHQFSAEFVVYDERLPALESLIVESEELKSIFEEYFDTKIVKGSIEISGNTVSADTYKGMKVLLQLLFIAELSKKRQE